MWFTYIIYSAKLDRYYVGYTDNLPWRLERHNQGWGRYTRAGIPWKLVYAESHSSKSDASKRERDIKRKKSRSYIEYLINSSNLLAGNCPA
jgi:putative endonuclease